MNQDNLVIVKDGQEVTCDVLFSFICNENNRAYVGYTDHSKDETGKENIYVSVYDPSIGFDNLQDIKEAAEWDLVNGILKKIKNLK